MQVSYVNYTLEQGLVDIQRYDQETCNLNVGLNELRASLISGPGNKRFSDPILESKAPPISLLPPPTVAPSGPPAAPPAAPAPHQPSAGRPTTKLGDGRVPDSGAALTVAIDRIKQGLKVDTLVAEQLEKCGLPKDPVAAAALTNTRKSEITICLNKIPIIAPAPLSEQEREAKRQLSNEISKFASPPTADQINLSEGCLVKAGFDKNVLIPDLLTRKLAEREVQQVRDLARCLGGG